MMSSQKPEPDQPAPNEQRLQKVIAAAGFASRRAAEELMLRGKVKVNGEVVTRVGAKVDPEKDVIHVRGQRLVLDASRSYYALHKPVGVVSAMSDPQGRETIADLLPEPTGLYHVGRLDIDSEGLLLVTNDGDLTHRLTHPSFEVRKTYVCEVSGKAGASIKRRLLSGVELEDGTATADAVRILESAPQISLVEVAIHSGRNRIVRRMLGEVGLPVRRLVRTQFGPIRLGQLKPGALRRLSVREVGELHQIAGM